MSNHKKKQKKKEQPSLDYNLRHNLNGYQSSESHVCRMDLPLSINASPGHRVKSSGSSGDSGLWLVQSKERAANMRHLARYGQGSGDLRYSQSQTSITIKLANGMGIFHILKVKDNDQKSPFQIVFQRQSTLPSQRSVCSDVQPI